MSLMVSVCAVLSPHEMSVMRSGTELSQFPRVFLPTLGYGRVRLWLQMLYMDILILYTDNPTLPLPSGHKYGKTE